MLNYTIVHANFNTLTTKNIFRFINTVICISYKLYYDDSERN